MSCLYSWISSKHIFLERGVLLSLGRFKQLTGATVMEAKPWGIWKHWYQLSAFFIFTLFSIQHNTMKHL